MNRKYKPPFDSTKLFALMEESEVELLLASTRHNIRYLTGGTIIPSTCGILMPGERSIFLSPAYLATALMTPFLSAGPAKGR